MLDCLQNHHDCNDTQPPDNFLPSRVIDVGPADASRAPFLLESSSQRGLYVALSYRWGDFDSFKTQMHNISGYRTRIPINGLSKTIQDAISFTRMLHIQYLWVDALCIIQDSEQDWNLQASKMADIYRNSLLTL